MIRALLALVLFALPLPAAGDLPTLEVGGHRFHRRELANGLRAVAVRDEGERASVFLVLAVGNRQETPETTGLAHLVEHAMFAGTPTTGTDQHEARVVAWGGESNAFTREDHTLYYDHGVPVERLDEVLAMEADRLRNLAFEEGPVLHERGRLEREEAHTWQPSDGREEALEAAVFRVHPYRAGLRDEAGHTRARGLSVATVRDFYERWYHPRNACVVVVGPYEPEAALDAVERAFGALPAGPEPAAIPVEPWIEVPRTERIPSALPRERVELCWLAPELGDPARPALELLADLLGRRQLAGGVPVEASGPGRVDRDLFRVAASGEGALEGLRALVEALRAAPPDARELEEVKQIARRRVAERPLRARPYFSLAATFGTYEALGHAERLAEHEAALAAVGPQELFAAARRWLDPERCVTVVFEGTGAEVAPLPDDAAALTRAARDAIDAGDHARAIQAYARLLAKKPNRMNTVIYLAERGQLKLDLRDYDGAIADFEEALGVVDYPAVRDLLKEAESRKLAAQRGDFGEEEAAAEPEPSVEQEEPEPAAAPAPEGLEAELRAGLARAREELEGWRGLRFLRQVEPDFVEEGPDSAKDGREGKLGGWYEPDTERLVVVLSKGADFARGAQLHELFHALQDQHWDLSHLHAAARTTDEERALAGLIEGEAMLAVAELLDYDFERHAVLPPTGELDRARFEKIYQYGTGLTFVRALREGEPGGWAAVNRAWGRTPRSSAELFHPERYPAPPPESLADLPLEGELLEEDVWGEFELRWLLAKHEPTRALHAELASALVADRYAKLRLPDGSERERWDLRLRDLASALRLTGEARPALEAEGWSVAREGRSVRLSR